MLNKILGRDKTTNNIGNEIDKLPNSGGLNLVAYITLPELNNGISEPIEDKLTIGSEIGDLIIEQESLSPRHCTFIKKDNVICVIDHSSIEGTFLNKKRLDSGKTFIVNEKDKIRIGKINAIIEYLEVPVNNGHSELPVEEAPGEELVVEDEIATLSLDEPEAVVDNTINRNNVLSEISSDLPEEEYLEGNGEVTDFSLAEEEAPREEEDLTKFFDDEEVRIYDLDQEVDLKSKDINLINVEEVILDPQVLQDYKDIESNIEIEGVKPKRVRGKRRAKSKVVKEEKEEVKKIKKKKKTKPATHVFFRFIGLAFDIAFCFTIINIFYVFIDFQNYYKEAPVLVKGFLVEPYNLYLAGYIDSAISSVPELGKFINDIVNFPHLGEVFSFIFLLISFRIITTLIFSVSLGNAIIGIRSHGNTLGKRVLGSLREFVGIFTYPLFIFDLPTFLSKRSFKEIMTKTHLYNSNKMTSMLLVFFFIPVLIFMYCLSPILKGLDVLPQVGVEQINKVTKPWQYKNPVYSELLNISYDLNENVTTLPSFQIEVKQKKRYLTFGLLFLNLENANMLEIRKVKEFSMFSVYKDFVGLNYLSQFFQPEIYGVIKDVSLNSDSFKRKIKNKNIITEETKGIIKSIFSLNIKNLHKFIINNGPVVAGHRDFREKIENLVSEKIRNIKLLRFGQTDGFMAEHKTGKKMSYSFIPLGVVKSQLYLFSKDVSSPKLSLLTDHITFGKMGNSYKQDPIAEFTNGFKQDANFEDFQLAQAVYDRYYGVARTFMQKKNKAGSLILQKNLNRIISVLGENKLKNKKLYLNLTEMLDALKKENSRFFNVQDSKTVFL